MPTIIRREKTFINDASLVNTVIYLKRDLYMGQVLIMRFHSLVPIHS
jgi:hypothetical protein